MNKYGLIIVAIFVAGFVWFWRHPYLMVPKTPVSGSLTEIQNDLRTDPAWKVVIVTASWCPACQRAMPVFAHLNFGSYVNLYALSVDSSQSRFEQYAQQTGGNIKWIRMKECRDDYCMNLIPMLGTIGLHYPGSIPYVAIFDQGGKLYAENIPVEYVECTIRRECKVKCSDLECRVSYN